jgi:hypothetical protein
MPSRKKPNNAGQTWFPEVMRANEEYFRSRPLGMPCLEVLATEMARYAGLPASDAEYLYDRWLANGFKISGRGIKNWKACMRDYYRNGWLPSQKGIRPGQKEECYPTYERVQSWCLKRGVGKGKGNNALTSRAWGELMTGKFRGKPITNERDFEAAMEVLRAQWMREP